MSKKHVHALDGFHYSGGQLNCESLPLTELIEVVGTPAYIYSKRALIHRVKRLQDALAPLEGRIGLRFAVKSCSNLHILKLFAKLGCGADIVSGGELYRSSLAGILPEKTVFSGVGKSDEELKRAVLAGIELFNVESLSEARLLNSVARNEKRKVAIALRFNPNISARTHKHIATGLKKSKFGLTHDEIALVLKELKKLDYLVLKGLSCHIGSQITELSPFKRAWSELITLAKDCTTVETLNIGGGLGINYLHPNSAPTLEDFSELVVKTFSKTPYNILVEPGRSLVGPAAVLLTKLLHIKVREGITIAVLDAGMNDLIRPAMYGAEHALFPIRQNRTDNITRVACKVVGPICESADTFSEKMNLDLNTTFPFYALGSAGAYGMSMASQYNSRGRPPEVLVDGDSYRIIRRRETHADLISHEI